MAGSFHWPEADYQLSETDEQVLADRLSVPERFNLLEIEVMKAVVGPASHELLELLWHRTKRMTAQWRRLPEIQILMIWLGALMNRDIELVDAIEPELRQYFTEWRQRPYIVEFYPNWQFGKTVATWLRDPTTHNKEQVEQIISSLRSAKIKTDARWFNLMFKHTQASRPHHNSSLRDNL